MARVTRQIRSRVAVEDPAADGQQPIYTAALLRLALKMKRIERPAAPDWDRLVDQALGPSLGVDRHAFRGYLERNYSFLLASLGQKDS